MVFMVCTLHNGNGIDYRKGQKKMAKETAYRLAEYFTETTGIRWQIARYDAFNLQLGYVVLWDFELCRFTC